MTRKDYRNAAEMIREEYGNPKDNDLAREKEGVILMFVRFFKRDNSAFDITKFREACE